MVKNKITGLKNLIMIIFMITVYRQMHRKILKIEKNKFINSEFANYL